MNSFFKMKFIIFISILFTQIGFSQNAAVSRFTEETINADTLKRILPANQEDFKVDVRLSSENLLDKYKNDPDFNYDDQIKEAEDWITKIRNWINQFFISLMSSDTYSTLLDYFYYTLMAIALILIVRGLIKGDRRGLLFGKTINNEIKTAGYSENLDQINFNVLIENYIQSKQYKLAIRYLFLKSLKLLADNGLIEINKNKSNQQYLSEIKNRQVSLAFRKASIGFEWIWYGDFQVDDELMKSSRNDFNNLFGLIKS